MAGITTTTFNDLVQAAILEADTQFYQSANLLNYVTRFDVPHLTANVPIPAAVTMTEVTEGTEFTTTSDQSTGVAAITSTRWAEGDYISELVDIESVENVFMIKAKSAGEAAAEKVNQLIWAQFDLFTTNTLGTTNTNITIDLIRQGIYKLDSSRAKGQKYLAVTPHVMNDLRQAVLDSTSGEIYATAFMDSFYRGENPNIMGVEVVQVNDLVEGTSAGESNAADAKCAMWTKDAIGFNFMKPLNVDITWTPNYFGNRVLASFVGGAGILRQKSGCEILVDNLDA